MRSQLIKFWQGPTRKADKYGIEWLTASKYYNVVKLGDWPDKRDLGGGKRRTSAVQPVAAGPGRPNSE
ncbi:hypothetical protein LSP04_19310 [Levilactobacillus spicheri]|uniref:Uncharacterized protein n=1 Tax=Levilactobacillus spicheri TaxID=216463 RepID=A0ABQ0WRP6_9LACO|nr:hypothetical protein LSP04_19310 [Levilactobacillus spicheri]